MAPLQEYRRKRRFAETPEPPPARKATPGDNTFVVQKHDATRLHYDFRLEVGGVLDSWAVPKGPSLNPADKRLAVQTEDHPLDYGGFEGTIPDGNYGAGTVMVWDRGRFNVEGDADAARQIARGEIKFNLQGEKLRGSFVLVKLKHSEKGNEWLLIKHKDEAVDPRWDIDEHDGSALTGRTLDEIAAQLPPRKQAAPMRPGEIPGAKKAAMPARISPMLATLIEKPFSDPEWLFEIKWDGVRCLAFVDDGKLTLRARSESNITARYPELAALPEMLHARRAILDGEIVALDERGVSSFERLQQRMHVRAPSPALVAQAPATYYVFDLLYCDGYDLRDAPLSARKELLRRILVSGGGPGGPVRFSDHQPEKGRELFDLARQNHLEGIIGKRADSRYASTRSTSWVKIKVTQTLDAVVGGWTAPRGAREHFGSLLLGLYDGKMLRFIGHVGTGFDERMQDAIAKLLAELQVAKCPFDKHAGHQRESLLDPPRPRRPRALQRLDRRAPPAPSRVHRHARRRRARGLPLGRRNAGFARRSRNCRPLSRRLRARARSPSSNRSRAIQRQARKRRHRTGRKTPPPQPPQQGLFPRARLHQARSARLLLPHIEIHPAVPGKSPAGAAPLSRWSLRPGVFPEGPERRPAGLVPDDSDPLGRQARGDSLRHRQ